MPLNKNDLDRVASLIAESQENLAAALAILGDGKAPLMPTPPPPPPPPPEPPE